VHPVTDLTETIEKANLWAVAETVTIGAQADGIKLFAA